MRSEGARGSYPSEEMKARSVPNTIRMVAGGIRIASMAAGEKGECKSRPIASGTCLQVPLVCHAFWWAKNNASRQEKAQALKAVHQAVLRTGEFGEIKSCKSGPRLRSTDHRLTAGLYCL
jgi:hypothetical protein